MTDPVVVRVPGARVPTWVANFNTRHGEIEWQVGDGALRGAGGDGSHFSFRLPFGRGYQGPPELDGFLSGMLPPDRWGVLLVRKGGFAVARLERDRLVASKVGRRHVQGKTKAGGQSQQRFARRRDNQAKAAYAAATEYAVSILGERPIMVVTGGDPAALSAVLEEPRLRAQVVGDHLAVPDPRRGVLEQAIRDASAVVVEVVDTTRG